MRRRPGEVRDAIVHVLEGRHGAASVHEITNEVVQLIGDVPPSSIRSYLRLNTPVLFARMDRAQYVLNGFEEARQRPDLLTGKGLTRFSFGRASLVHSDCNTWLDAQAPNSLHAVVTDPPYGLVEYSDSEQAKLRQGRGGVWRIPPSFDGSKRSPLPIGNGGSIWKKTSRQ